jgi:hypothetical protein
MDNDLKSRLTKSLADYLHVAKSGANGQAHSHFILALRKDLSGIEDRELRATARKLLQKIVKASQRPRQDERSIHTPIEIQGLAEFVEKEL